MMKKLTFSIAVITAATVFFLKANKQPKENLGDYVLANVEALASNEIGSNEYYCIGTGNVICPGSGKLVAAYYKRRNLE